MTREQALKFLPDLFRKSSALGVAGETLTAVSVFITWLYQHGFTVMSRKEMTRYARKP